MAWWFRYGGKVSDTHDGESLSMATWIASCDVEEGAEPSSEVAEMPLLCLGAREPWDAFQVLTKRRPLWSLGMGGATPGHIPISEIREYMDHLEIEDSDDRDFFFKCIDALDDEYVRLVNEDMAQRAKDAEKK